MNNIKSEKQKQHMERLNKNQKNENNRNWKGDKAGYKAVHLWVRSHLEKPTLCPMCKKIPPREVANLDGKYSRDLSTWKWLCRSCHLRMDNVAKKAWETKRKNKKERGVDLSV